MAKKNKPVEVIDFNKLPKRPLAPQAYFDCANCGQHVPMPNKLRGLVVHCPDCFHENMCK